MKYLIFALFILGIPIAAAAAAAAVIPIQQTPLIADLDSYPFDGMSFYVTEDNGVYTRISGTWTRQGDWPGGGGGGSGLTHPQIMTRTTVGF